jgi:hypothetical protein
MPDGTVRQPGELVPEAAQWRHVQSWVRARRIRLALTGESPTVASLVEALLAQRASDVVASIRSGGISASVLATALVAEEAGRGRRSVLEALRGAQGQVTPSPVGPPAAPETPAGDV